MFLMGLGNYDGSFNVLLIMPKVSTTKDEISFKDFKTDEDLASFMRQFNPELCAFIPNLDHLWSKLKVSTIEDIQC